MSASVASVGTAVTVGSATWALTLPSGTAAGDLLLAHFGLSSVGTISTSPSGWAQVTGSPNALGGDSQEYLWYKTAGAGEANPTWTWTASKSGTMQIIRVIDWDSAFGIHKVAAGTEVSSSAPTTASITPTENGCLLLAFVTNDGATGDPSPWYAADTGNSWSDVNIVGANVTGAGEASAIASKVQASAAAITHTWTMTTADITNSFIIAVASAAAAAAAVVVDPFGMSGFFGV